MKRMFLLLTVAFCLCAINKASAQDVVASGQTGDCRWTISGTSGYYLLTISGNGAMEDYSAYSAIPWFTYRSGIKMLDIQQGVTVIGRLAFYECYSLTSATIPNSVTNIGVLAFGMCYALTSVFVKSPTPPELNNMGIFEVSPNIAIHVPCGTADDYQSPSSGWSDFTITADILPQNLTALSNNPLMGTVTITDVDCETNTAVITPVADAGYRFVQWSDGETENPRTVTVTRDTTFTAEFGINTYHLTVAVAAGCEHMGAVNDDVTGDYPYNTQVEIAATPADENYRFEYWSDGETENPRTVTVTEDVTYTAIFKRIMCHLTVAVAAGCEHMGTVNDDVTGDYTCGTSRKSVRATANEGYRFVRWIENNSTDNPHNDITVTGDVTFTALFEEKTSHQLTVNLAAGCEHMGTVAGGGMYREGTTATIQATPANDDYRFVQWEKDGTLYNKNPYTTVVVTEAMTLTAVFEEKPVYQLTVIVAAGCEHMGTVTGGGTYKEDATVDIAATPADDDHRFLRWEKDGYTYTDNPYTVVVTEAMTFTAVFEKIPVYRIKVEPADGCEHMGTATGGGMYKEGATVDIEATPNYGYHFAQWNDAANMKPLRNITVTGDATYTAVFEALDYHLTVEVVAGYEHTGTVTGEGYYPYNTPVDMEATPNYGYHFVQWQEDGSEENPRTVTLTQDTTFTAVFEALDYHLTVEPAAGYEHMGTVTGGGDYSYNTPVDITAIPANEDYRFLRWEEKDGATYTDNPYHIVITKDMTFTAVFEENRYHLTVEVADGCDVMGTVNDVTGNYLYNTQIKIAATARYGYRFVRWNDGDEEPSRTITLTQDTTFTAEFETLGYHLTIEPADGCEHMGTFTGEGNYPYNTQVDIAATPNYGYHFLRWTDGDEEPSRTITLTQDTTFIAEFETNLYHLTVEVADGCDVMGTVNDDVTGDYPYNTSVDIAATARYGYRFVRWSDGDKEPVRTITLTQDTTLTAEFKTDDYHLAVEPADGCEHMGTVNDDVTGDYPYNTSVDIAATARYGYHFVRWSDGDTEPLRTIIITQDTTLIAEFETTLYHLTVEPAVGCADMGTVNDVTGDYPYNTSVDIAATAHYGYRFVRWSDGDEEPLRTIIITQDTTLLAEFEAKLYHLTVAVNEQSNGMGTVNDYVTGDYPYNTRVKIKATANDGYHFIQWNDGDIASFRTITITEDIIFTATFEDITLVVTFFPNPAQDLLYFLSGTGTVIEQVTIYDVSGRLLKQFFAPEGAVDVRDLVTGVYIVRVTTCDEEVITKVVKK
jgi:hypothetical protein